MDFIDADSKDTENLAFNENAVKNSIRNILLTPRGSMPSMPNFGSDIAEFLFENMDFFTVNTLEISITNTLREQESRLNELSVKVESIPEYNKIVCTIVFTLSDDIYDNEISTSITLNQGM